VLFNGDTGAAYEDTNTYVLEKKRADAFDCLIGLYTDEERAVARAVDLNNKLATRGCTDSESKFEVIKAPVNDDRVFGFANALNRAELLKLRGEQMHRFKQVAGIQTEIDITGL